MNESHDYIARKLSKMLTDIVSSCPTIPIELRQCNFIGAQGTFCRNLPAVVAGSEKYCKK
jgi:hypothetical protein